MSTIAFFKEIEQGFYISKNLVSIKESHRQLDLARKFIKPEILHLVYSSKSCPTKRNQTMRQAIIEKPEIQLVGICVHTSYQQELDTMKGWII